MSPPPPSTIQLHQQKGQGGTGTGRDRTRTRDRTRNGTRDGVGARDGTRDGNGNFFSTQFLFTKIPIYFSAAYIAILAILITPKGQSGLLYLNWIKWPFFSNFDQPQIYGFAPGQVRNFYLQTPDGAKLGIFHSLPDSLYNHYLQRLKFQTQTQTQNRNQNQNRNRNITDNDNDNDGVVTDNDNEIEIEIDDEELIQFPKEWWDDALRSSKHPTIIYCHGNGATRLYGFRVLFMRFLAALKPSYNNQNHNHNHNQNHNQNEEENEEEGYNIITLDYRGFADSSSSSTHPPTEAGLILDVQTVYKWLTDPNYSNSNEDEDEDEDEDPTTTTTTIHDDDDDDQNDSNNQNKNQYENQNGNGNGNRNRNRNRNRNQNRTKTKGEEGEGEVEGERNERNENENENEKNENGNGIKMGMGMGMGISENKIGIIGHSLGTAVAVGAVAEGALSPRTLILLSPFSSLPSLLLEYRLFKIFPLFQPLKMILPQKILKWILHQEGVVIWERWDSEKRIGKISSPILILHSTSDSNVPSTQSFELFSKLLQPLLPKLSKSATVENLIEARRKVLDFDDDDGDDGSENGSGGNGNGNGNGNGGGGGGGGGRNERRRKEMEEWKRWLEEVEIWERERKRLVRTIPEEGEDLLRIKKSRYGSESETETGFGFGFGFGSKWAGSVSVGGYAGRVRRFSRPDNYDEIIEANNKQQQQRQEEEDKKKEMKGKEKTEEKMKEDDDDGGSSESWGDVIYVETIKGGHNEVMIHGITLDWIRRMMDGEGRGGGRRKLRAV